MRIVAGRFGGRRIEAPAGKRTRPTADRVREAVFSMLGDVEGLTVLDLFAGSGALGLEALSRGAETATFVDCDRAAAAAVDRNLASLGVEATVERLDAFAFLDRARAAGARYDIVFVDPPYSSACRVAETLATRLPEVLTETYCIVSESDKRAPLQLPFPLDRERAYGDTLIRIHRAR